jgi:multiple sugar transport system substrate-binding protein/arabinosaccharide transport system substrate-binding protein
VFADSPERVARATNMTINMWTHDPLYVKFFTERGKEWAKKYPQYHFTFNFVEIPYAQLFDKVLANLAAGTGAPDMVGIEIGAFSRFMKGNIASKGLVDLTPLVGAQRKEFVRWEPYMYKGRLYGVESGLSPSGLYYREDFLTQAGIKAPLATYNDLIAAGRILLKKQNRRILLVGRSDTAIFLQMFQQLGGNIFDASGNLTLDDPRAVQVLEWLVKGAKENLFFTPPDEYGAPALVSLKVGKVAGALMPDWYSGYILKLYVKQEAGKWRVQNLPVWSSGGRRLATLGGTGFAITKQSKHPQLVWSLLHYTYMTEENQVKRFQELNYFPTMKEAWHDPRVTSAPDPYYGGEKLGSIWAKVASQVPSLYQSPFSSDAGTQLTNEYTNAMLGRKTPSRAIKDAVAEIKKIMARGS